MAAYGLGKATWLLLLCCLMRTSLLATDELADSEPSTTSASEYTDRYDDELLAQFADTSKEVPGSYVAEENSTTENPIVETLGPKTDGPLTLSGEAVNLPEEASKQKVSTDKQEQNASPQSTVPGSGNTDGQPLTGHPRQSPRSMVSGPSTRDPTSQTADSGEPLTGNTGTATGLTDVLTQTPQLPESAQNTEPTLSGSDQVAKAKKSVVKPVSLEDQTGEATTAGCRTLLSSSVTYVVTTVCLLLPLVMQ